MQPRLLKRDAVDRREKIDAPGRNANLEDKVRRGQIGDGYYRFRLIAPHIPSHR